MNNELLNEIFRGHLKQAFGLKKRPKHSIKYRDQVEVLYDEYEVARALKDFDRQGGWIAFDYETNCLKPDYERARIYTCAVSNGERTVAYPWRGKAIKATWKLLESSNTRKIASNIKMEERWTLRMMGEGVSNWGWDTMLASHVLDNRPGICSLKFQAFVRLGVPEYNTYVEKFLGSGSGVYNNIDDAEVHELLIYNGMDAILEYYLAQEQRRDMGYAD